MLFALSWRRLLPTSFQYRARDSRVVWDIHEIARFAGHRNIQTTLRYIHLSGRELAAKFENGMAALHAWRVATIGELLK
jgi:integrase/recombinase XerD